MAETRHPFEQIWDETGTEHHRGRKRTSRCEVCGEKIADHPCLAHRQAVQQEANKVPPPDVF